MNGLGHNRIKFLGHEVSSPNSNPNLESNPSSKWNRIEPLLDRNAANPNSNLAARPPAWPGHTHRPWAPGACQGKLHCCQTDSTAEWNGFPCGNGDSSCGLCEMVGKVGRVTTKRVVLCSWVNRCNYGTERNSSNGQKRGEMRKIIKE